MLDSSNSSVYSILTEVAWSILISTNYTLIQVSTRIKRVSVYNVPSSQRYSLHFLLILFKINQFSLDYKTHIMGSDIIIFCIRTGFFHVRNITLLLLLFKIGWRGCQSEYLKNGKNINISFKTN